MSNTCFFELEHGSKASYIEPWTSFSLIQNEANLDQKWNIYGSSRKKVVDLNEEVEPKNPFGNNFLALSVIMVRIKNVYQRL